MRLPHLLTAGLGLASPALAILVAPGSPCASRCGNVLDSTSSEDIPCDESAYSSGAGAVFKSCVDCQLRSTYFTTSDEFSNKKESDLQWMICEPGPFFFSPFSYFFFLSFLSALFALTESMSCGNLSNWT